jgi:surfeit locus 1 family protein
MYISIYNRKISFKPSLWPTLGTLIFLPLCISLGIWQWHRAEYKEHLLDHYSTQSGRPPLTLEQALKDPEGFRYFAISVQGHYLTQTQFLQENQFYQHQIGYYVLTPFLTNSNKIILVNRGWVPKEKLKEPLSLSAKPQTVSGRVSVAPRRSFHLGENLKNGTTWPRQFQVIKIDELSTALGKNIEPLIVLLNPQAPDGFARDWQPQGLSPEKHRGYALQWFAFASLIVILFLALNLKRI